MAHFSVETPHRLERMRQAFLQADGKDLAFVAHSLKGSSAQIGALRIASLSAEIEEKAGKGDLSDLEVRGSLGDLLGEITREVKRTMPLLEQALVGILAP